MWICPVCASPLILKERSLSCENNHVYDLAKEGYCNLLLAQQKNSKEPGDSKEMLHSRRDFLQAGYYRPLASKMTEMLSPFVNSESQLLDCGCGEGYYTEQLSISLGPYISAIDIAKDGVRLAAKRFKNIKGAQAAVASSFKLPLPDHQFDAIMQVFAPVSESELLRVLKTDGIYCDVSPGPHHFRELKEKLYDEVRPHELPRLAEGFVLIKEEALKFAITLSNNADLKNLLMMTPLYWKGSREAKAELMALDQFTVTIDFLIRLYQPATNDVASEEKGAIDG